VILITLIITTTLKHPAAVREARNVEADEKTLEPPENPSNTTIPFWRNFQELIEPVC
jgi:hypothetical protein